MDAERSLDIVIPVFGGQRLLDACLDSIFKFTSSPFAVYVVDDGPDRRVSVPEWVTYLPNSKNMGFGPSCNRGAKAGSSPFICFLNSDTIVTDGWDRAPIADLLADPFVAIVGVKLVYPLDSRRSPGRIQNAGIVVGNDVCPIEVYQGLSPDDPAVNERKFYHAVTGACMFVRRSWFPGFDEQFSVGCFEDVDLCLQAWEDGMSVLYEPDSIVYHYQGQSYDHSRSAENFRKLYAKWRRRVMF